MRQLAITLALLFAISTILRAQDHVTLQFVGQDQNGQYVRLNSVLVENITKHWQEVLYYPDTTLSINCTGIEDARGVGEGVHLFQNVPNPFEGVTDFALQLPKASNVQLEIYDMHGKVAATYKGSLDPGCHQFRTWLATPQTYLLNARTSDGTVQIKMINTGNIGQSRIEYVGVGNTLQVGNPDNGFKGDVVMPFNYGDSLAYNGYARLAERDFESAHLSKSQYGSELITLPFNLPLPSVTTKTAVDISDTSAILRGSVVEDDEYIVTEKGFLFADNEQFVGADMFSVGLGSGDFEYTVTNLQMLTRYYYRTYAQSAMGTTYGAVLSFETVGIVPLVHTLEVTNISITKATSGGHVSASGGSHVTARGICWSTSQYPTISDNHTINGSDTGTFVSTMTGLMADTTYYVRAYATNSDGTAYGEQRSFITLPPFYCGVDSVTDYDGNTYGTVQINNQCWLKENLRVTHYSDGSEIYVGLTSGNVPFCCPPNGDTNNIRQYGYLYSWYTAMHGASSSSTIPSGVQGICPPGWHLPSDSECVKLVDYVKSQSCYACGDNSTWVAKSLASTVGWISHSGNCTVGNTPSTNNATGLSLMPAGYMRSAGQYASFGYTAGFFTTTCSNSSCISIYLTYLCHNDPFVSHNGYNNINSEVSYPVRCILDESGMVFAEPTLPAVTTAAVTNILAASAISGGHVIHDGGANVTARGVCWSTTSTPTIADNYTENAMGIGSFSSSITGLSINTTYYVRAYATNSVGTAYGEQVTFSTPSIPSGDGQPCPNIATVTDCDGNVYNTVKIGTQCWLKENLRTTHYSDSTIIPLGSASTLNTGYRYIPNNDPGIVSTHGYLYNWAAVMHGAPDTINATTIVQGICPTGWHVPTTTEFDILEYYLINQYVYACGSDVSSIGKALASTTGWSADTLGCAIGNNPNLNNVSGFSALPAGKLNLTGSYDCFSYCTIFWTSTELHYTFTDEKVKTAGLFYSAKDFWSGPYSKRYFFSVRCIRD